MFLNENEEICENYAFLFIGEDLQKALNAEIETEEISGIKYFLVDKKFYVKSGRCSCSEVCWHIFAVLLKN